MAGRDRGLQESHRARIRWRQTSRRNWRRCTCGTIALDEAVSTAEQALKVAPANPEAHRVLGLIAAAKVDLRPRQQGAPDANLTSAILHLEQAIANPIGEADPNARGTLARLYLRADHVREGHSAPRRSRTPAARRGSKVRACWHRPTRAPDEPRKRSTCWTSRPQTTRACCRRWRSFYERQRRWKDAANAYARALDVRAPQRGAEDALRAGAAQRRGPRRPGQGARGAERPHVHAQ